MKIRIILFLIGFILNQHASIAQSDALNWEDENEQSVLHEDSVNFWIEKQKGIKALGIIKLNLTGKTLHLQLNHRVSKPMNNGRLESVIMKGDSLLINIIEPDKNHLKTNRILSKKPENQRNKISL